jgi:P pilus assembly chaperone PapD
MNLEKVTSRQDIKAVTSNGKITAEGVSASQSLTLKTSNGGIRVSNLDSAAISLITSNAGIKGSLPGKMADYTVKSATSNGKNNLPNERAGGEKTLNVKTSNANISLEFE